MARDRRDIAEGKGRADAPALAPASADDKGLAGSRTTAQDRHKRPDPERDLFHDFLRSLARDAARRDHAADPD